MPNENDLNLSAGEQLEKIQLDLQTESEKRSARILRAVDEVTLDGRAIDTRRLVLEMIIHYSAEDEIDPADQLLMLQVFDIFNVA